MIEASAAAPARTFVYVSAATAGTIDIYEMDEAIGALKPVSMFDAGKMVMPMTVSPDKRHLYAVLRSEPYRVLTLALDRATGKLEQMAVALLPDNMAYISTDPSGRLLLAASYGGNKIAALPIASDGLVKEGAGQVIPTGRNAHSIVSDRNGKYVFATNLGSDAVLQFILNAETGLLTANDPPQVATGAGFGPRHIAVSPDNKSIYVLTELTGHVIHYALDADTGTLCEVESIASVPADAGLSPGIAPPAPASSNSMASITAPVDDGKPKVWAADIGITPNGKFLYTTERTTSTIALLRVGEPDGRLAYVTSYPTEQQPRGICIDPSGRFLVASGEKSDRLSVYAIDQTDGVLTPAGRYPVSAGANWIEIVTFQ
ncbi:6-phosphogluconolactonase [Rhizobium sp. AC27/96]|uniref:lactonase family protein n=1 Tax=Rhizobium sp. AC27/96 TaxID=1841653 RepID=UPI0008290C46|nr:lactonase family protein [Rhizobium sp. AC27/96]OCJ06953.1 6-phosphogluconolactonase [Rhizobium sp. AC27/96]